MVLKKTYYECEICHKLWEWKELADVCESHKLPPCAFKKGLTVEVKSDDGDFVTAAIGEVTIRPRLPYNPNPRSKGEVAEWVDIFTKRGTHAYFIEVIAPCDLEYAPQDYSICPIYEEKYLAAMIKQDR